MIALDRTAVHGGLVYRRPGGAPPDGTKSMVEIAVINDGVFLRVDGRVMSISTSAWTSFIEAAKSGEYDDTLSS